MHSSVFILSSATAAIAVHDGHHLPKTCLGRQDCDVKEGNVCYTGGIAGLPAWQKKRDVLETCSIPSDEVVAKLKKYMEPIMKKWEEKIPIGFQFAFHGQGSDNKEVAWDYAGGYSDLKARTNMTSDDLVPGGSYTKPLTAGLIMKHIEAGTEAPDYYNDGKPLKVTLDTPVRHYVDYLLKENMNMTMTDIFPDHLGGKVNNHKWGSALTIDHFIGMTACTSDYDDNWDVELALGCPDMPIDPYMYLNPTAPKGGQDAGFIKSHPGAQLWFAPDKTCKLGDKANRSYSGLNFIVLGLVLTHLQGHKDWKKMDQYELFDDKLFPEAKQEMSFGAADKTGGDLGWIHQYRIDGNLKGNTKGCSNPNKMWNMSTGFVDMIDTNSLNGWTMGNAASTMKIYAKFLYNYFNGNMGVSKETANAQRPGACAVKKGTQYNKASADTVLLDFSSGSFPPKSLFTDGHKDGCGIDLKRHRYRNGYGSGLELVFPGFVLNSCFSDGEANAAGHMGVDYASQANTAYIPDGNFAVTFGFGLGIQGSIGDYVRHNKKTDQCECVSEMDFDTKHDPGLAIYFKLWNEYILSMAYQLCTGGDLDDKVNGLEHLFHDAMHNFLKHIDVDILDNKCLKPIETNDALRKKYVEKHVHCDVDYWRQYGNPKLTPKEHGSWWSHFKSDTMSTLQDFYIKHIATMKYK